MIQPPDWESFRNNLWCHASNYPIGHVLVHEDHGKILIVIHYASRMLNNDQKHYTTNEKEFLGIIFACDEFRYYIKNWSWCCTQIIKLCNIFLIRNMWILID
jgi:hypothetical protein